jgi:hypothetical protein
MRDIFPRKTLSFMAPVLSQLGFLSQLGILMMLASISTLENGYFFLPSTRAILSVPFASNGSSGFFFSIQEFPQIVSRGKVLSPDLSRIIDPV